MKGKRAFFATTRALPEGLVHPGPKSKPDLGPNGEFVGLGVCELVTSIESSLRNKRPSLSGRPSCKGVAIGVARRGGRLSGKRTLHTPPSCSDPVSYAGGPHVASFVVDRSCACVRAGARVRVRARKRPAKKRARACACAKTAGQKEGGNPEEEEDEKDCTHASRCRSASPSHEATVQGSC